VGCAGEDILVIKKLKQKFGGKFGVSTSGFGRYSRKFYLLF